MYKSIIGFIGVLVIFCFCQSVLAATYTVTKIADTNDGLCDADCSLREAVSAANATADNDTIEFAALFNTEQTITLSGGQILLVNNGSLTINGTGAALLTISGNNTSRIFSNPLNSVFNINNLRLTGGNGVGPDNTGRGGAIYNNSGSITITNSILTGNKSQTGGALSSIAADRTATTITIVRCIITNNTSQGPGSALQNFSESKLNIRDTTISGNTSNSTGLSSALEISGTETIANSTISGNLNPFGTGGGIYTTSSSLIIVNTTIVNNSSNNSGGGIRTLGGTSTYLRNTIIANNSGGGGIPDVLGSFTSQGSNIIGNVTGSDGWITTDLQNVNPSLGALANNGGFGETHLPLSGSPAIDAGQNCVLSSCPFPSISFAITADQRGFARPYNGRVDIGAVEFVAATVSGQILTSSQNPVKNAIVTISDSNGVVQSAMTNNFGYFTLIGVQLGQSYTLNVAAKQNSFTPQNITINSNVTNVVITANP